MAVVRAGGVGPVLIRRCGVERVVAVVRGSARVVCFVGIVARIVAVIIVGRIMMVARAHHRHWTHA